MKKSSRIFATVVLCIVGMTIGAELGAIEFEERVSAIVVFSVIATLLYLVMIALSFRRCSKGISSSFAEFGYVYMLGLFYLFTASFVIDSLFGVCYTSVLLTNNVVPDSFTPELRESMVQVVTGLGLVLLFVAKIYLFRDRVSEED